MTLSIKLHTENLSDTASAKSAAENFQAADKAEALPEFEQMARLTFKQRLAFSYIRVHAVVCPKRRVIEPTVS